MDRRGLLLLLILALACALTFAAAFYLDRALRDHLTPYQVPPPGDTLKTATK